MKLIFSLLLLAATPSMLFAQTNSSSTSSSSTSSNSTSTQSKSSHRAYGYVFAAPGVVTDTDFGTATLHFGGGGEGLIKGGFGVGAEIGGVAPIKDFGEGFGVFSAGANYHFLNASKSGKIVPFINGGYTMFFRSAVANGGHFGGGVNYWFKDRVGLRFEVRDHIVAEIPSTHFIGFRVGLTFR